MKKITYLIPLTILTFFLFPFVIVNANVFTDITSSSTIYFNSIEYLKSKGVISGYPDGTFKPDNVINRAEALKMIMLATGKDGESTIDMSFPDVNVDDWFFGFVRKALESGLVEGYPDGTFKPENNINIAESLKIIILAFDIDTGALPSKNPFPDVDVISWYVSYAEFAKNKNFIEPSDDGLLHAEKHITRGQFAEIIFRIMYTRDNNLDVFPLSTNWDTFYDSKKGFSFKYPPDWKVIKADDNVILWKRDSKNEQLSWARVLPLSATVVIAVDDNESKYSLKDYTDLLEYDSGATRTSQKLNDYPFAIISMPEIGINDYFFQFNNKKILVAYTQIGLGNNSHILTEKIRYIIGSIKEYDGSDSSFSSLDTDKESFLSEVRKLILVKGKATSVISMFDDTLLLETDSIGIGTGPVDYYYSPKYDVTMKLERNSDTILALNTGKSTSF